jgi:hypothetical protein
MSIGGNILDVRRYWPLMADGWPMIIAIQSEALTVELGSKDWTGTKVQLKTNTFFGDTA